MCTEAVSRKKKVPIQKYLDTCGQGIRMQEALERVQKMKVAKYISYHKSFPVCFPFFVEHKLVFVMFQAKPQGK